MRDYGTGVIGPEDSEPRWPIGQWATRPGGKAHHVESEITDRIVMKCGRQMRLKTRAGELIFQSLVDEDAKCEQCTGHIVED